jgi:Spy/CpxP family protein refolding chaperone
MKRTLPIALAIALALVITAFTPAHARWGEGRPGRGRQKMDKEQMRERIELLKMWKLIEVLDLDQETAMKLFPVMHEFDVKQDDLRKSRGETFRQMKEELSKDAADPAVLSALTDQFKKSERAMTEVRIERLDALSKILSEEQIAKMITLVPQFEQKIRGLMSEAKARHKERKRWMKHREDRPRDTERGPRFE